MAISEEFVVTKETASPEDIERALALLSKEKERKAKIARGELKSGKSWSELTEAQKEERRAYNRRRQIKLQILANKAIAQGIVVTDEEVELALIEKGILPDEMEG